MRLKFSSPFILLLLLSVPIMSSAQDLCESLVKEAMESTNSNCIATDVNNACYGFDRLLATFHQAQDEELFDDPAEFVEVLDVHTVHTDPIDLEEDEWGVSYFQIQGSLHSETDESLRVFMTGDVILENAVNPEGALIEFVSVTVVTAVETNLFNGANIESDIVEVIPPLSSLNADAVSADGEWVRVARDGSTTWVSYADLQESDTLAELVTLSAPDGDNVSEDTTGQVPMQQMYFDTAGESDCREAPNTVIMQGPKDVEFELLINGVPITAGSTIGLGFDRSSVNNGEDFPTMFVATLEGEAILYRGTPNEVVVPEGTFTVARMTNNGGLSPDSQLVESGLIPVFNKVTGSPIFGPDGEVFFRRIPIERFAEPREIPFSGGFVNWEMFAFIIDAPQLLNYPFNIPVEIVQPLIDPECEPDSSFTGNYQVQVGDTLEGISNQTGIPVAELVDGNCIANSNLIYVGQFLNLPAQGAVVEEIEVPATIPQQPAPLAGVPATLSTVGTPTTTATVGGGFGTPLATQVLDGLGNPVVNTPVTFSINNGVTTLSGKRTTTIMQSTPTMGYALGLTFNIPSVVTFANRIGFAMPSGIPTLTCATPPAGYGAYFDVTATNPTACQTSVTVNTDASGNATAPTLTAGTTAGTFTATISAGGVNSNVNFTSNPDTVSSAEIIGDTSTNVSPVNKTWLVEETVNVSAVDTYGNKIPNSDIYLSIDTFTPLPGAPTPPINRPETIEFSTDNGSTWNTTATVNSGTTGQVAVMVRTGHWGNYSWNACPGNGACSPAATADTFYGNAVTTASCSLNVNDSAGLQIALEQAYFCDSTIITLVAGAYSIPDVYLVGNITINGAGVASTTITESATAGNAPTGNFMYAFRSANLTMSNLTITGISGSNIIIFNNSNDGLSYPVASATNATDGSGLTKLTNVNITNNPTTGGVLTGHKMELTDVNINSNGTTSSVIGSQNGPNGRAIFTNVTIGSSNSPNGITLYSRTITFNNVEVNSMTGFPAHGINIFDQTTGPAGAQTVTIINSRALNNGGTGFNITCEDDNTSVEFNTTGSLAQGNNTGIAATDNNATGTCIVNRNGILSFGSGNTSANTALAGTAVLNP